MTSETNSSGDGEVVVECGLDASPEKVWRALTIPELAADWLGAAYEPASRDDAIATFEIVEFGAIHAPRLPLDRPHRTVAGGKHRHRRDQAPRHGRKLVPVDAQAAGLPRRSQRQHPDGARRLVLN